VIGLAYHHATGKELSPSDFSGGVGSQHANRVLERLGFQVATKNWTAEEVESVVTDYFDMLQLDLLGETYNKAQRNRELQERLLGRSRGSVEYKHENISAVLIKHGLPYIDGYKPRSQFQALLEDGVLAYLDAHPEYFTSLANAPTLNPQQAASVEVQKATDFFESVPEPEDVVIPVEPPKPWLSRRGKRENFAAKDARNRKLGVMGEEWVVDLEKRRLDEAGRDDLSGKVEWVAQTCGDGVGFDVLSFDEQHDSERFIEVKTTTFGKHFPFYVTRNEVACSEDVPDRFNLYRVFLFSKKPRLFRMAGALSEVCDLRPTQYQARMKRSG